MTENIVGYFYKCGVCGEMMTGHESATEVLEMYDDGPGKPNDPRRYTTKPSRASIPGATTQTWYPCGHTLTT